MQNRDFPCRYQTILEYDGRALHRIWFIPKSHFHLRGTWDKEGVHVSQLEVKWMIPHSSNKSECQYEVLIIMLSSGSRQLLPLPRFWFCPKCPFGGPSNFQTEILGSWISYLIFDFGNSRKEFPFPSIWITILAFCSKISRACLRARSNLNAMTVTT